MEKSLKEDALIGNSLFEQLSKVDVSEHVEEKKIGNKVFRYLSWAWAISYIKKIKPNMSYTIKKWGEDQLPYQFDANTGYMVYTEITIDDVTAEMWLPVLDGANNAMKAAPYTVKTSFSTKDVAAATMADINKTIMRCLVKNLAMFGLGIALYVGEDLPTIEDLPKVEYTQEQIKESQIKLIELVKNLGGKSNELAMSKLISIINTNNPNKCVDKDLLDNAIEELNKIEIVKESQPKTVKKEK